MRKALTKKNLRFRFPPEPNGYLHIGHAKAIGINFGLGEKYEAPVNLRFDDTNPTKEEQEYVDAIIEDIDWLNYAWDKITYSSDHFEKTIFLGRTPNKHRKGLYRLAKHLIKLQNRKERQQRQAQTAPIEKETSRKT